MVKMVKNTQIIRRQQPTVFEHFVELALRGYLT